jgi:hypothetical protein
VSHDEHAEPAVGTQPAPPTEAGPGLTPDGEPRDAAAAMAEVVLQTDRAVIPAVALGVVALVVGLLTDQLLAGVGVCIGLALGLLNARMLRGSVQHRFEAKLSTPEGAKSHFLAGAGLRLTIVTVVTLLALILVKPLGIGIVIGLVVFQLTLLGFSGVAMYRSLRP